MKIKILLLILLSVLSLSDSSGQKANRKTVISGSVTDLQHKPVKGAWILIDGTKTNMNSNHKGMYKIKILPDADSITVISLNNGIRTEAINGRTIINFTLDESVPGKQSFAGNPHKNESVNIGYGYADKKNLLTPVNKIDGSNSKYASYSNIYDILREIPGVLVNGTSVQIQGAKSLLASNEPLYILNGTQVQTIDWISPVTIKNISILKGSSATIYGSRGANGVILIDLVK